MLCEWFGREPSPSRRTAAAAAYRLRFCCHLSAAKAKRFQHYGKGGRVLPTTWVVEMVAGERLAPIFQHPHELLFRDRLFDQVLGQVSQPEPVQHGAACEFQAVDRDLALDAHID